LYDNYKYSNRTTVVVDAVPIATALVAFVSALVRWWLQGSHNLYTALDKRFYIPDPDLGWRVSPKHPIWLGLDSCAVLLAVAAALAIGLWMLRRRSATVVRAIAWLVGAATLAAPIAAIASGGRPDDVRDELPFSVTEALDTGGAIDGALDARPGRYEVVAHDGTSITAHLSAGGESFDARFTGDIRGSWRGDPHDLAAPTSGGFSVAAASVDTGVSARSRHARDGYLKAATYPRIEVTLDRIVAAHATAPRTLAFRARGTLSLIGKTHAIEFTGTIAQPDDAGLARLGLSGEVLVVTATFSIRIADTALAANAGDFNGDRIPIAVSLVLRRTP
jgi:polyisoprenoid-binding protein YceI